MVTRRISILAGLALGLTAAPVFAADTLQVLEVRVDPPTTHTAGVQLLISDDDDRDAAVAVRVRPSGAREWRDALPLLRVWPETVAVAVPQQFAGSIFDLEPGTTYEVELHVVDPDGLDTIELVEVVTRPLPREPANPVIVDVGDVAGLQAALAAAAPGHVITLAPGTYAGTFSLQASGTPEDPIVLRGADEAGVILDGMGCMGCNILEVYGAHVHVERMTLAHGERALRFQGEGTTGNVVRHVTIADVVHGIAGKPGQSSYYICDNDITGRLVWPWTFAPDATMHWDDRGVEVTGDGHVICHNRLRGFGDPVVNKKVQARAWDVFGNDILDAYDGTEIDTGEGNVRLFLNRFTNVMDPVSIQPSHGGPAYVLRNVVLNAPEEPIKMKSIGGVEEPSGVLVYHNTFVSPRLALDLQAPITQHNFAIANNLFVGPEQLAGSRTVDWTPTLNGGSFDYNGYWPDGEFWFGVVDGENQIYPDFAAAMASGAVEAHGVLLARPIFAADFVGPADPMAHQEAADFALDPGSAAIDRGLALPGVNASHAGDGPDLGAREHGCPAPIYGPRPLAADTVVARVDCVPEGAGETDTDTDSDSGDSTTASPTSGDATTEPWPEPPTTSQGEVTGSSGGESTGTSGGTGDPATASAGSEPGDASGCACRSSRGGPPAALWLLALAAIRRRRR